MTQIYAAIYPDGSFALSYANREAVEAYIKMATVDGYPAPQLVTFVPYSGLLAAERQRDEAIATRNDQWDRRKKAEQKMLEAEQKLFDARQAALAEGVRAEAAEARVKELVAIAEQDAIDMACERAAFVQLRKALEESNERLRNYVKMLESLDRAAEQAKKSGG